MTNKNGRKPHANQKWQNNLTLEHLELSAFLNQVQLDRYKILFDAITEMQPLGDAGESDQELLQQTWERCKIDITRLNIKLDNKAVKIAQHRY